MVTDLLVNNKWGHTVARHCGRLEAANGFGGMQLCFEHNYAEYVSDLVTSSKSVLY